MDLYKELQTHIDRSFVQVGQLSYEKHQLQQKIEQMNDMIVKIVLNISDLEVSIIHCKQTQRDFNSYLAVKEGAVTLETIKEGIENGGKQ